MELIPWDVWIGIIIWFGLVIVGAATSIPFYLRPEEIKRDQDFDKDQVKEEKAASPEVKKTNTPIS